MKTAHFMPRKYDGLRPEIESDVNRLVKIAADQGVEIAPADAMAAWEDYSETSCAGWLMMPQDDELVWAAIQSHIRIVD